MKRGTRDDKLLHLDLNTRLSALIDDFEREVLDIALNILVGKLAANETLDVVDGAEGV